MAGLTRAHVSLEDYGTLASYTPALANRLVVPGQAMLYGFTACSTNAGSQFILLFDSSTSPANGAVPLAFFPVSTNNLVQEYYGPVGRRCYQGITLCNSSTAATLTAGSADTLFDVQYITFVEDYPSQGM